MTRILKTLAASLLLAATPVLAQTIDQAKGADSTVNYAQLQDYGPWDDRNYQLTAADLRLLAPNEAELHVPIPAFFRVELRREFPGLQRSGPVQYPRAAVPLFYKRYQGLTQDGKLVGKGENSEKSAPAERSQSRNVQMNEVLGANEVTIEQSPVDAQVVIAGANNNGGQEMYYSSDGGANWTVQGVLPDTCCDPTVDWSSDGSVAYVAALSGSIGVSVWRSFDQGVTWQDRVYLTNSGSDKEFLHSDKSASSPYKDNVYVTYHNSNVMQFARSTDISVASAGPALPTFDIISFNGEPSGIGSDITTTNNGDIYTFYGSFTDQTVRMLKSTDGGDSFAPSSVVAPTNGAFDFPIPAMDSRFAWIYASTDADRSGGLYEGNVYVAWADTTGPESGAAQNNHTVINVAYSSDGGASWNISNPHPMDDTDTVDRFNPWLTVDQWGNVHVGFYDTRHSPDRTGVDFYTAMSSDGAQTWQAAVRVSTATSANLNDGQEWGDYNGLSVVGDHAMSAWTDNRDGPPNQKKALESTQLNPGAEPTFFVGASNLQQSICTPGDLAGIQVSSTVTQDFSDPVTLASDGLPAGFSETISTNPFTPPTTVVVDYQVAGTPAGDYAFDLVATSGSIERRLTAGVSVFDAAPPAPLPVSPPDGSMNIPVTPTLTFQLPEQAGTVTVEIDDDPEFGSLDATMQTTLEQVEVAGLTGNTTYYWRVRGENVCGVSPDSETWSFTTAAEYCSIPEPALEIPDNFPPGANDLMIIDDSLLIDELTVKLKSTHTWIGDLVFSLTHEDTGNSVMLIDRPGVPGISPNGCSGDNIDVSLHDSSILPVEDQCSTLPALGGTLQPQEPLAAFAGENISGTWTLTVSDNAGADLGTLNTWCLEAIPVDEASTFTVLVVDDTQGDLLVPQAIEEDLQSLGYDTVRVTTAGDDFEPTLSEMHAHDLTLWLTGPGELPSTGPGPATEPEIQSHIESGGCFAISSPGWFSSRGLTPLMSILGVDFAVPDTGLDEVSGLPPFFDMLGTVPVTDPNADQVEAAANAEPAMLGTPGGVAVRRTKPGSPSVYFGFDLVNLPDGDTRRTVLEGIVAMCRDFLFADGAESP